MRFKRSLLATVLLSCTALPAFAAENPMDHFGVQHNLYLRCLHDIGANVDNSLALLVDKCGYDPGVSREKFIEGAQPIIEMDPTLPLAERLAPFRSRYTAYEFSFYERIDGVVRKAQSLEEAEVMFAELEREALANLDAKRSSGANVLAGLSIARHSLRYWTEYAARGETASRKRKWWHWVVIVVADVAGGVAAAETVVGAIGAAAGASEAANDLIDVIDPP